MLRNLGFIKINRTSTLILMAGSVLFLYLRKSLGFDLYCCLDSTIMAIPYYLAGYWLKVTDGFGKLKPLLLGGRLSENFETATL